MFRKIEEEYILVPVRKIASDVSSIFSINPVGSKIWELISPAKTVSEIIAIIADEFEVDKAIAEKDTLRFIKKLKAVQAIIRI